MLPWLPPDAGYVTMVTPNAGYVTMVTPRCRVCYHGNPKCRVRYHGYHGYPQMQGTLPWLHDSYLIRVISTVFVEVALVLQGNTLRIVTRELICTAVRGN
eukprot:sb/3478561/